MEAKRRTKMRQERKAKKNAFLEGKGVASAGDAEAGGEGLVGENKDWVRIFRRIQHALMPTSA